ncbi:targeted glyoxalase II, putative [Plasmodium gallinaceum]|uniref:Targeted glyoxalase II, putative n=1 Tax=Plasmodium gallinaceum TaxID=5849 RepID=A0A1J1GTU5_PLAGA|nr:targeted glyoxalase II, putative [Plasmodium gallinaceum]CRG95950.1 targeted glyoxalase II, putative [Plasmodium gallinaceum]
MYIKMKILKTLLSLNYFANIRYNLSTYKKLFIENGCLKKNICETDNKKKYYIINKKDICTNVIIIPLYKDNYSYIFYDNKEEGVAVDPSNYKIINEISEKENIKIKNILCTHKHYDHNSGNFFYFNKKINVYGIKENDNEYINKNLNNISNFEINNFKITTFISNFHCKNHISYLIENSRNKLKKIFFTGDFLFICGIGRNFESNNNDLYNSINNLNNLDKKNTYIFCGHEYTLDNIKFALSVDSFNNNLKSFYEKVKKDCNTPTVPSLLEEEFLYNPFLRYNDENIKKSIKNYAMKNNYVIKKNSDYLILLRIMKDNFKLT